MKSKHELSERAEELASFFKAQGITYNRRYLYTGSRVQRIKFWGLCKNENAHRLLFRLVKQRLETLGLKVKVLEQRWVGTSIVVYFTDENIGKKLKLPKYKVKKKKSSYQKYYQDVKDMLETISKDIKILSRKILRY